MREAEQGGSGSAERVQPQLQGGDASPAQTPRQKEVSGLPRSLRASRHPTWSPLHPLQLPCIPLEGRIISQGPSCPSPFKQPTREPQPAFPHSLPCLPCPAHKYGPSREFKPSLAPLASLSLSHLYPVLCPISSDLPPAPVPCPHIPVAWVCVLPPQREQFLLPALLIPALRQASACTGSSHPLLHWVWLKAMPKKHPWTFLWPLRRDSQQEQVFLVRCFIKRI